MCIIEFYNNVLNSNNWDKISNFMDGCESLCIKYGSCDYFTALDEKLRVLDGQATKCACCGEVYNYEDMTKRKTGWYCDRCIRAEESRC